MPDRDLSPTPESPQSQLASSSVSGDDIELPAIDSNQPEDATKLWPDPVPEDRQSDSKRIVFAAIVLAGLLAIGYWTWSSGESEQQHPNWQHVQAATTASSDGASQLVTASNNGTTQLIGELPFGDDDLAMDATQQIRAALEDNDVTVANEILQRNQSIPPKHRDDAVLPTIEQTSGLTKELEDGTKEFFQVELFDCCDEDGDVVDVAVNGQSFATVPIVHQGTRITIPLSRGPNTITIQGVRDGGGGVTLGLATSKGHFFMRYLAVGEACDIGVRVQ